MKKILSIAGSDPSGEVGIRKDLVVFQELGALGLSAVTAQKAGGNKVYKQCFVWARPITFTLSFYIIVPI